MKDVPSLRGIVSVVALTWNFRAGLFTCRLFGAEMLSTHGMRALRVYSGGPDVVVTGVDLAMSEQLLPKSGNCCLNLVLPASFRGESSS